MGILDYLRIEDEINQGKGTNTEGWKQNQNFIIAQIERPQVARISTPKTVHTTSTT